MAKKRKETGPLLGTALALGVYLLGLLALAWLLVRGTLPESAAFPAVAGLCAAATFSGGLVSARRMNIGTLPAALLPVGCFILVLLAVGFGVWQNVAYTGRSGGLLLCALAGGLLAGLLGGRRKRKPRRAGKSIVDFHKN
ncbi:hypothetical protein [uncultured Dysosmobacter sp.]|uniref:hypothetical protein n=1 Tax=uncultured Dysosmobacter sp. TaxID=2591384 RepID=UPI0026158E56|nr:hypothetical protein [uncultured Dysosmobacter sp.]